MKVAANRTPQLKKQGRDDIEANDKRKLINYGKIILR